MCKLKECCPNFRRNVKNIRKVIFTNEVIYLLLCVGLSTISGISSQKRMGQQQSTEDHIAVSEETPTVSLVGNSARFLRKAMESSEEYEESTTEETSSIVETTTVIEETTTVVENQETQQPETTIETLPEETTEQNGQSTYISDEEKKLITKVVYVEARGECYEGQVAVAAVILNRYHYNNEQVSIWDIVTAPNQFGDIYGITDWDLDSYPDCARAVEEAISGVDPTDGCRYFYDPRYVSSYQAQIREGLDYIQIGNHRFHWSL